MCKSRTLTYTCTHSHFFLQRCRGTFTFPGKNKWQEPKPACSGAVGLTIYSRARCGACQKSAAEEEVAQRRAKMEGDRLAEMEMVLAEELYRIGRMFPERIWRQVAEPVREEPAGKIGRSKLNIVVSLDEVQDEVKTAEQLANDAWQASWNTGWSNDSAVETTSATWEDEQGVEDPPAPDPDPNMEPTPWCSIDAISSPLPKPVPVMAAILTTSVPERPEGKAEGNLIIIPAHDLQQATQSSIGQQHPIIISGPLENENIQRENNNPVPTVPLPPHRRKSVPIQAKPCAEEEKTLIESFRCLQSTFVMST